MYVARQGFAKEFLNVTLILMEPIRLQIVKAHTLHAPNW